MSKSVCPETLIALDKQRIMAALPERVRPLLDSVTVVPEIGSTQHFVKHQVKQQSGGAHLCMTEQQTAGKGRRDREWVSVVGQDILLSLSWQFERWPSDISALSLAVAAVTADWLATELALPVRIKWPNDILLADAKLAGILVDVTGEANGHCQLVLGMGLNVCRPPERAGVGQRWTDLASHGVSDLNRNRLAAAIVTRWVHLLEDFTRTGWSPYLSVWQRHAAYLNQLVVVGNADTRIEGVLAGVDDRGQLIIRQSSGQTVAIYDAELSLRPLADSAELMQGNRQ